MPLFSKKQSKENFRNNNANDERRSSLFDLDMNDSNNGSDHDEQDNDNDNDNDNDEDESNKLVVAKGETKAVHLLKFVVIILLLVIGFAVSITVYTYTANSEEDEFNKQFTHISQQIITNVNMNVQYKMEVIGSLALQIQSHVISNSNSTIDSSSSKNNEWPFVTIPFYEQLVMATKSSLHSFGVVLYPIVSNSNRLLWESYSVNNNGWINNSYDVQYATYSMNNKPNLGSWYDELWIPSNNNGTLVISPQNVDYEEYGGMASTIFNPDGYVTEPYSTDDDITYYPQWQAAPLDAYFQSRINMNYANFDDFNKSSTIVFQTGMAVLGEAWSVSSSSSSSAEITEEDIDVDDHGEITTILYPIYDQIPVRNNTNETDSSSSAREDDDATVVAFLGAHIYWETYLEGILGPHEPQVYVVINSTCNQTLTYELSNGNVTYIGRGDQHDILNTNKFDTMKGITRFGETIQEPIVATDYGGIPLYDGYCQYDFNIYPSQELQDYYMTNTPRFYATLIGIIFLFAILVFLLYDRLVERRQKLVMKSAKLSDSILNTLYPTQVKDQLFNDKLKEEEQKQLKEKEQKQLLQQQQQQNNNNEEQKAIAQTHPHVTLLFADMPGFMQWTQGREAADVFKFLETVYLSYDKIAARYKVFKIETIGDCYVAVTGLPNPQPDHAVIMARFAHKIQQMLQKQLKKLAVEFGPEVLEFGLRCGMHSGSVLAGVLRGEKGRFALYGDTMNTASRMESNGQKGKIQISQWTADLLIAAGKGDWLTARPDLVEAKGKGLMQTYWVNVQTNSYAESACSSLQDSCVFDDFME